MKKHCAWILLLVATIILGSTSVAFSGTGIVVSGKVLSISPRITPEIYQLTPESAIRIIQINNTNFFVDEGNVVIFDTVSPVNRYTFGTFNLRVGDNVTVIAEGVPQPSYAIVRVIIVLPAP